MPVMSRVERAFCNSGPWGAAARKVVLPWALAGQPLTGDVLEIGSGSGAMAEGTVSAYSGIQLTATDIDPSMVDRAKGRLSANPKVSVELADVVSLPFRGASFDYVTTFLMLHHVIEWQSALAEAWRVLRPGGLLVGYDLTDTRLARWTHRVDRSPHLLINPDELRAGLVARGFSVVAVTPSVWGHVMRFQARKSIDTR